MKLTILFLMVTILITTTVSQYSSDDVILSKLSIGITNIASLSLGLHLPTHTFSIQNTEGQLNLNNVDLYFENIYVEKRQNLVGYKIKLIILGIQIANSQILDHGVEYEMVDIQFTNLLGLLIGSFESFVYNGHRYHKIRVDEIVD